MLGSRYIDTVCYNHNADVGLTPLNSVNMGAESDSNKRKKRQEI